MPVLTTDNARAEWLQERGITSVKHTDSKLMPIIQGASLGGTGALVANIIGASGLIQGVVGAAVGLGIGAIRYIDSSGEVLTIDKSHLPGGQQAQQEVLQAVTSAYKISFTS